MDLEYVLRDTEKFNNDLNVIKVWPVDGFLTESVVRTRVTHKSCQETIQADIKAALRRLTQHICSTFRGKGKVCLQRAEYSVVG